MFLHMVHITIPRTIWSAVLITFVLSHGHTDSRSIPQTRSQARAIPSFGAKSAFTYLVKQTRMGPRAPGTTSHERCLRFLNSELRKFADDVLLQQFPHRIRDGKRVLLTNLIASFNVRAKHRIALSAHWDTRPWADQDPDPENHKRPIVGANDGASGVAVLLEIARQLKLSTPPVGVDIVLFDGEDLGTTGHSESFSVGSRYFSRNLPTGFSPRFMINIDMIGDRDLRIPREINSDRHAHDVMDLVYKTARDLGIRQFVDEEGTEITDDHMPLNAVGIPSIDLIDFNYPDGSNAYWHTLADTPDKCSAESLAAVGRVLLTIIYSKEPTLE